MPLSTARLNSFESQLLVETIRGIIRRLREEGKTVLLVEQNAVIALNSGAGAPVGKGSWFTIGAGGCPGIGRGLAALRPTGCGCW